MQLISQNLSSISCSVLKIQSLQDDELSIFCLIDDEHEEAYEGSAQQVIHFKASAESDQRINIGIQEGSEITLFIDSNFARYQCPTQNLDQSFTLSFDKKNTNKVMKRIPSQQMVVALQLNDQPALLLYPKALQQMPYLRLFKEAFLVAIPWLGLLISLFGLVFSLKNKLNRAKSTLKFSFTSPFYIGCTLISCYPLLLIYFSLNQYLPIAIAVSYCFLCLLNYFGSYWRNRQVSSYNNMLLTKIRSMSHFN